MKKNNTKKYVKVWFGFLGIMMTYAIYSDIKINRPTMTLVDKDGNVVATNSTSIEKAMEKASALPNGVYTLQRPDVTITVNNLMQLPPEPEPDPEPEPAVDLVVNGNLDDGDEFWVLPHQSVVIEDGENNIMQTANGTAGPVWSVQMYQVLTLEAGQAYRVSFRARSSDLLNIGVGLGFNHEPYTESITRLALTVDWVFYTYTITPPDGDDTSRVFFDMGSDVGTVFLDDISVIAIQEIPENIPPVAITGADFTAVAGSIVTLDGSRSFDSDGNIVTYKWEQVSGPTVILRTDPRTGVVTFIAPTPNTSNE